MIKKLIIVAGVVLVLGIFVFGRSAVSYVRTSAGYVTDSVRDAVPIEFEIQRARGEIENLLPEVRKNTYAIAKGEVEVQRLQEQVAQADTELGKDKGEILRLSSDLETGKEIFHYAGIKYTSGQVKVDVANRFQRYKTNEATLASLKKILVARQRTLEAARQKLEGMKAAKRQLHVEVENLEARLEMIAATKASSQYQFDDSRLGRVKELISNLRTRLDVAERMVSAETHFHGEIPLEEPAPENIVEQVTEYFSEGAPTVETVAAK